MDRSPDIFQSPLSEADDNVIHGESVSRDVQCQESPRSSRVPVNYATKTEMCAWRQQTRPPLVGEAARQDDFTVRLHANITVRDEHSEDTPILLMGGNGDSVKVMQISRESSEDPIVVTSDAKRREYSTQKGGQNSRGAIRKEVVNPDVNRTVQESDENADGGRDRSPSALSASSVASGRKLEWDSGADVGYQMQSIPPSLSTIERIALGGFTSLMRTDPEGMTVKQNGSKQVLIPSARPSRVSTTKEKSVNQKQRTASKHKTDKDQPASTLNRISEEDMMQKSIEALSPYTKLSCNIQRLKRSSSLDDISQLERSEHVQERSSSHINIPSLEETAPPAPKEFMLQQRANSVSSSSVTTVVHGGNKIHDQPGRFVEDAAGVVEDECPDICEASQEVFVEPKHQFSERENESDGHASGTLESRASSQTATSWSMGNNDRYLSTNRSLGLGSVRSFEYLPGHVYETETNHKKENDKRDATSSSASSLSRTASRNRPPHRSRRNPHNNEAESMIVDLEREINNLKLSLERSSDTVAKEYMIRYIINKLVANEYIEDLISPRARTPVKSKHPSRHNSRPSSSRTYEFILQEHSSNLADLGGGRSRSDSRQEKSSRQLDKNLKPYQPLAGRDTYYVPSKAESGQAASDMCTNSIPVRICTNCYKDRNGSVDDGHCHCRLTSTSADTPRGSPRKAKDRSKKWVSRPKEQDASSPCESEPKKPPSVCHAAVQKLSTSSGNASSETSISAVVRDEWKKPITYSEKLYEAKKRHGRLRDKKRESEFSVFEMEKENQLQWITNEIVHLQKLRQLLEEKRFMRDDSTGSDQFGDATHSSVGVSTSKPHAWDSHRLQIEGRSGTESDRVKPVVVKDKRTCKESSCEYSCSVNSRTSSPTKVKSIKVTLSRESSKRNEEHGSLPRHINSMYTKDRLDENQRESSSLEPTYSASSRPLSPTSRTSTQSPTPRKPVLSKKYIETQDKHKGPSGQICSTYTKEELQDRRLHMYVENLTQNLDAREMSSSRRDYVPEVCKCHPLHSEQPCSCPVSGNKTGEPHVCSSHSSDTKNFSSARRENDHVPQVCKCHPSRTDQPCKCHLLETQRSQTQDTRVPQVCKCHPSHTDQPCKCHLLETQRSQTQDTRVPQVCKCHPSHVDRSCKLHKLYNETTCTCHVPDCSAVCNCRRLDCSYARASRRYRTRNFGQTCPSPAFGRSMEVDRVSDDDFYKLTREQTTSTTELQHGPGQIDRATDPKSVAYFLTFQPVPAKDSHCDFGKKLDKVKVPIPVRAVKDIRCGSDRRRTCNDQQQSREASCSSSADECICEHVPAEESHQCNSGTAGNKQHQCRANIERQQYESKSTGNLNLNANTRTKAADEIPHGTSQQQSTTCIGVSKHGKCYADPTLEDYLYKNRPDYVLNAIKREQCLSELASMREERRKERQKLVSSLSSGKDSASAHNLHLAAPPPLAVKRIFNQRFLKKQTLRKFKKLPDYQEKVQERKRKAAYRTNRLMAEIYNRKLQQRALRGEVDLSNSVSVLSTL